MDAGKVAGGRDGLSRAWALMRLGRVSNLPTVWSNTLAGTVLAGGVSGGIDQPLTPDPAALALPMLAMSLFYVGGMFLNDAYDGAIDAIQRPERPIPAGIIGRRPVLALGFGMLATATILLGFYGLVPFAVGLALAGAIVAYDMDHKNNALSPLVMGLCRLLVYVAAAVTLAPMVPGNVLLGALLLLSYLVGLTYAAKLETGDERRPWWPLAFLALPFVGTLPLASLATAPLWLLFLAWTLRAVMVLRQGGRHVGRAVAMLIAGICLLDAVLMAQSGSMTAALAAVTAFALTYLLQRVVPGT